MHGFPNISGLAQYHPSAGSQTSPRHHPPPVGRYSDFSTADSGRGLLTHHGRNQERDERNSEKKTPLYEDLHDYIARQRKAWIVTRDAELAYPLQKRYGLFQAEVMADIYDIQLQREVKYLKRAREMEGATGIARMSWRLYQLKTKLGDKCMKHWLHNGWKHSRLNAQTRKLKGEYVKAQISKRLEVVREILWFANEEAIEDGDDGGYVRDNILNYIVTGYDSMFPISRDLEVDLTRT